MNNAIVPYNMNEAQNAYRRLQVCLSMDSIEAAISEIKTFLKMFPDVALAHNDLGVLYYRSGDNLRALANYEKANRLLPGSPNIIKNLAEFYFVELGWADDAVGMLTALQKQYPQDCELLVSLGMICERLGQPDEARTFYQRVLDFEPGNEAVRSALAGLDGPISAAEYRTPPPVQHSCSPLSSWKSSAELCRDAQAAVSEGRMTDAIAAFEEALKSDVANATIHNDLGVILCRTGNFDKAKLHYERAVAISPANVTFTKNLADLYYSRMGMTDEAVELYTRLLKSYPSDVEILTALAIISRDNNLKEQARTFIGKVLSLEPWNRDAREFQANI